MSRRRSSYQNENVKRGGGSASKVDLLKSALEINHKSSNSFACRNEKNSNQSLNSKRADSAPKLSQTNPKNISIPTLSVVVDEVWISYFIHLIIIHRFNHFHKKYLGSRTIIATG